MDAATFFANFEAIAEAPGGVGRLRELVLDLAVRGKLVAQDPTDEPAAILMSRVKAARPTLAKSLSARVPKAPDSRELSFGLPPGWALACLADLGVFLGGGTPSKGNDAFWGGEVPWVSPKDMKVDVIEGSRDWITDAAVSGSSVKLIPSGSLLMVTRGMILAHSFPVALTARQVTVNQDMKALVLALPAMGHFMLRCLKGMKGRDPDELRRSGVAGEIAG